MRFCLLEPGAHLDLMTKCNVSEGGGGTVSHIPPSGPCDTASVILPGGRQWVCLDAHFTEWAVCAVMNHLWGPGPEPLAQGQLCEAHTWPAPHAPGWAIGDHWAGC